MKLLDYLTNMSADIYWREAGIAKHFSTYIEAGATVLDIGAGSGKLAHYLTNTKKIQATLIDVVDHNQSDLPLALYDGKKLPFADNTFGVCMLIFVMHHAEDAGRLFDEVLRVAKDTVIVVEDTPKNKLENILWQKWDYLLNHAHHEDIAVAHEAKNSEAWRTFFGQRNVEIVHEQSFRTTFPVLASYQHSAFVLKKR